jgi:glycosyltransferase involved in cell wall biosynthesis
MFLLEKYVEWGIPRAKLRYEENGRRLFPVAPDEEGDRPRNRLGFFGQLSTFKGVNVLLEAMKLLQGDDETAESAAMPGGSAARGKARIVPARTSLPNDAHLWIHGANLEIQPQAFRDEFAHLYAEMREHITLAGRYEHAELPALMQSVDWVVVPSIWWENAPLVIQEAFHHKRPVICSDIGGMAEKVSDGVDGLHFRARNPVALAEVIRRSVTTPGLWELLRRGIPDIHRMEDHVEALEQMYESIVRAKRAGR